MVGPIRFVFAVIWFAIGLSMVGTLKECTAIMGKEAAISHKRGGISYGWWNRQLVSTTKKSGNLEQRKNPNEESN